MHPSFPKMIYHEDGRTHVLATSSSERPDGDWSDKPSDAHRRPREDHNTTREVEPEDEMARKAANLLFDRLTAEGYVTKRGPGRPKSTPNDGGSDAGDQ